MCIQNYIYKEYLRMEQQYEDSYVSIQDILGK